MPVRLALLPISVWAILLTTILLARAQVDSGGTDVQNLRSVIESQIGAFKRDDAQGAYSFAALEIQKIFPTANIFMQMVRRGYQPVYRPRSYAFAELTEIDGNLTQTVRIVGSDGDPATALYIMERQPDGSWKIGGCVLMREPGQGV